MDYRDLKMALDVLTEGENARIPPRYRSAAGRAFQDNQAWTSDGHIQGFGIGRRLVDGLRKGALTVKVYVDRDPATARARHPIPTGVELIGFFREVVPIDVETIGTVRLEFPPINYRTRPVVGGSSGAHVGVLAGTLGLLVRRADDEDNVYLLSTCHSLALSGMGQVGDHVVQPSRGDGGASPTDTVAELTTWIAPVFSAHGYPNRADAAIARATHNQPILPDIHVIGAPRGVGRVRQGTVVQKTGRTTGYTLGMVIDLDFRYHVDWPDPQGGFSRAGFSDQVLCTRYASQGDSGAAVLNRQGRVVGLHVGGTECSSFFCRIENALSALNCRPA